MHIHGCREEHVALAFRAVHKAVKVDHNDVFVVHALPSIKDLEAGSLFVDYRDLVHFREMKHPHALLQSESVAVGFGDNVWVRTDRLKYVKIT